MQTQEEFIQSLEDKITGFKTVIEKHFYYLESEDLLFKPDQKSWNTIEVFEHLNLTNEHYLKEFSIALNNTQNSTPKQFKLSWMGKRMIASMQPKEGNIPFKMKTFKKTDPLVLQAKGRKLIDHIVLQDFIQGLDEFLEILKLTKQKDIQRIKIKSLIPILRLKVGDAFGFIVAHMERHLLQAQHLSPNERI